MSQRASPPPGFHPMEQLQDDETVDMVLPGTGEIVDGWLFRGHPRCARTYWMRDERGRSRMIEPIGWRKKTPRRAAPAQRAREAA